MQRSLWLPSCVVGAMLPVLSMPALAQNATHPSGAATGTISASDSIWTRPTLGGSWWGLRPELKKCGLAFGIELTQFGGGLVSGEGSKSWQSGGKLDVTLTLDGAQSGLWKGLYVCVRGEQNYGNDLEGAGGTLVPNNASLFIPGIDEGDVGVEITQKLSDTVAVKFGKLNMVDAARATPIKGGGGVDTFMNTALAVPVSGLMPPEIFGAFVNVNTKPVSFAFGVYDPISAAQRSILDDPFSEGVSFRASATLTTKILGAQGFYGIKAMCSTMRGFDLRSVPDLLLPPESVDVMTASTTPYYVGVSFQQYIHQDADDPKCGWGIFGEFGITDGNPTPQKWAGYLGVGGTGPFPGRSGDRWGVAVFRNSLSSHLVEGLEPLLEMRDEQGLEAFYNVALTPWFHVTPDIQLVHPFMVDYPDAVIVAFRASIKL